MMNGAMAIFSSPVICSFGLTGSFIFTSTTPAIAASGTRMNAAVMAKGLAVFVEGVVALAVRFHRHGEVVVRHGVARIDVDGTFEAELRLAPQVHPRHLHAEILLRGRTLEVRRVMRATEQRDEKQQRKRTSHTPPSCAAIIIALPFEAPRMS